MRLVIFITDKKHKNLMRKNPLEFEVPWTDPVEYGGKWAKFWPTDIVMLVEEDE